MPRRLRRFFRHGLLPQLIAFEAAVRLGSVTRAAEELSVSQPTVSGMLRKLSDAMGGPVMQIRDRRVEPTAIGRNLLQLCRDLIGALDRFEERRAVGDPLGVPMEELPLPEREPFSPRHPTRWRQRAARCRRRRGARSTSTP